MPEDGKSSNRPASIAAGGLMDSGQLNDQSEIIMTTTLAQRDVARVDSPEFGRGMSDAHWVRPLVPGRLGRRLP
jgi:uncharacterized protein involved in exopolysaccharide biosynthesis